MQRLVVQHGQGHTAPYLDGARGDVLRGDEVGVHDPAGLWWAFVENIIASLEGTGVHLFSEAAISSLRSEFAVGSPVPGPGCSDL